MATKFLVLNLTSSNHKTQAGNCIALFLSHHLNLPMVYNRESFEETYNPKDRYRLLVIAAPTSFCGVLNEAAKLYQQTDEIIWIQNDYSVSLGANCTYSKGTKATTPYRKAFYDVPKIRFWSTCKDILDKRQQQGLGKDDQYVNWNGLFYAPLQRPPGLSDGKLLYYGSFRQNRVDRIKELLDGNDDINVSVSVKKKELIDKWAVLLPKANLLPKQVGDEDKDEPTTNKNPFTIQPLTRMISSHRHSIYIADEKSNGAWHSLANRFYEVLSTPRTVLWLDARGEWTYKYAALYGYESYMVDSAKDLRTKMNMDNKQLDKLANIQRERWLMKDPYVELKRKVTKLFKEL